MPIYCFECTACGGHDDRWIQIDKRDEFQICGRQGCGSPMTRILATAAHLAGVREVNRGNPKDDQGTENTRMEEGYDRNLTPLLRSCSDEELHPLVRYMDTFSHLLPQEMMNQYKSKADELARGVESNWWPRYGIHVTTIVREFRDFGSHSLFGRRRRTYKEIADDVADQLKAGREPDDTVGEVEGKVLLKLLGDAINKMTTAERKKLEEELRSAGWKNADFTTGKPLLAMMAQAGIKMTGFLAYRIAVIVANAIAKAVLGRGLTLAGNRLLTKLVGVFAGPEVAVIDVLWTLYDLLGPAYRVTIPCVAQIAFLRLKQKEGPADEEANARWQEEDSTAKPVRDTSPKLLLAPFQPSALAEGERMAIYDILSALVWKGGDRTTRGQELHDLAKRLLIHGSHRLVLPDLVFATAKDLVEKIDPERRRMILWDLIVGAVTGDHYDARCRTGLRKLAELLAVPWQNVADAESELARGLRKLAPQPESPDSQDDGRFWKVALIALAGGVVLAATAGMAAPAIGGAIGTYFMGYTGAAATSAGLAALGGGSLAAGGFGMAGGTIVVTGAGAAIGATLFGVKAARLFGDVEEFQFEHIGGEGLPAFVGVSGWLNQETDLSADWKPMVDEAPRGDHFALRWESKHLRALGEFLEHLVDLAGKHGLAKTWAKRASKTAAETLAWPAAVIAAADLIDNPWHVAVNRADKAGALLADNLIERVLGNRPVTLIGFSLGSRLIFSCLQELGKRNKENLVENAFLLGGAFVGYAEHWTQARRVVSDRLVNVYSENDLVLALLYRTAQAEYRKPSGLAAIGAPGVEDVDTTDLVDGHVDYMPKLQAVLERIDVGKI